MSDPVPAPPAAFAMEALVVDAADPAPPFRQVRTQLTDAIASGGLPAGSRLPTVRHLAAQLNVAPGTVARAYRELEAAGLIQTRGRSGSFVSWDGDPVRREAQRLAAEYVRAVTALGLDGRAARELVASAVRAAG